MVRVHAPIPNISWKDLEWQSDDAFNDDVVEVIQHNNTTFFTPEQEENEKLD